jgi:TusA-related sulfurtransferase
LSPDHHLDVSGTRCPVPLLMTARCVEALAPGERLRIVGTDREMLVDLPRWCAETGHRLLEIHEDNGRVRCLVEARASA